MQGRLCSQDGQLLLHSPTVSELSCQDLGTMTVLDDAGEKIELASLWADSNAVLVFVRHFG